jgi:ribokinase
VDPTGAGDTFCGATLAGLARGQDPITAARHAATLAARKIEHVGPAFLLGFPLI